MPRPKEPSANQIRWETIMFADYANEYDRIRALAYAYREYQIDASWFCRGLSHMFMDDAREDWLDEGDHKSLRHLCAVLVRHKMEEST